MFGTPQLVNEGALGLPPSTKRLRLDPGQAPAHALHTISTGAAGAGSPAAAAAVPPTPPAVIMLGPAGFVPAAATQPPAASPLQSPGSPRSPAAAAATSSATSTPRSAAAAAASPRGKRDSRTSLLSPAEKMDKVLKRFPRSFCEELGIDIASGSAAALWQWLCAAVLFSARIKSNAAMSACKELFGAGLTTPQAFCRVGKARVRQLLSDSGYGQYEDKAAGFLVDNAAAVVAQYGGDLNNLRAEASNNAQQERVLLKKLKGTGDGAVDIFFRQVQQAWEEAFPFADKKALKAARLVGFKEHPQALAELCGGDRAKYSRLLAALVHVDMAKAYSDF